MAANKKKQDEKHLKMLREMVSLSHNKQCFDCHQRGPTYVNMTIGSFVCTSCSGILRGLNPPHRVKSISMTSFTPDEMEFLRSRLNEFCRKVWLGLYDSRKNPEPDSKDENKIRDFMINKYEKKRWYCAPTETMHEDARKMNTPAAKPDARSQRLANAVNISSQSAPSLSAPPGQSVQRPVGSNQPLQITSPVSSQPQMPASQPQPVVAAQPAAPGVAVAADRKPTSFDLLGELGGDPFAAPSSAQQTTTPGGGFADFANFGSSPQTSAFPPSNSNTGFPAAAAPVSSTGMPTQSASFAGFPASTPTQPAAPTVASATNTPSGDKYAALADLDSVFGATGKSINWNGVPGDHSAGGSSDPPGGRGGNIPWGNTSAAATPSGAFMGGGGVPTSTSNPNMNAFGTSAANPFGGGSTQSSAAVGNPFMSATQPAQPAPGGFGAFGQPPQASSAFGQPPASSAFGQPPVSGFSQSQPSGFSQSQPSGFSQSQPSGFSQSQSSGFSQSQPSGFSQSQPSGFSQSQPSSGFGQPTSMAGFGQQPSAGFGQFSSASTTPSGGGVQNGGFPPAGQQQSWAFGGAQPAPATQAGMNFGAPGGGQFGAKPPAQPGFGVPQQQGFGGWGAPQQPQAVGNPFMGAPPSEPIPPRGGSSTNPFL